jgi:hypothetical protein
VKKESAAELQKVIDATQRVDDSFFGFDDSLREVEDLTETVVVSFCGDEGPHRKSRCVLAWGPRTSAKESIDLIRGHRDSCQTVADSFH